jgi:hypothetical protein
MKKEPEANLRRVDNESSVLRKDLMTKTDSQRLFLSIPVTPAKRDTRPIRRYME